MNERSESDLSAGESEPATAGATGAMAGEVNRPVVFGTAVQLRPRLAQP